MTKVKPHQTFQLGEITTAVGMMGVEEPKELSSAVLNFPKDIPFQYDYEVDTFYVRPCYARYYEYITNKFAETGYTRKRGVTVTGTPGIGKSMFMAYFFLRYRFEHQHENPTIIMTSYNTSSILEEIVLWKDGLKSEEFYYDLPHLKKLYHEYPNALVLLDGPPAVAPRNQKYVAFTSPNESWFHRVRKDRSHKTIYMPLWDEEELTEAVDLLGLRDSLEPLDLGDDFPRFSNVMRYEKEELYRFDVLWWRRARVPGLGCEICEDSIDIPEGSGHVDQHLGQYRNGQTRRREGDVPGSVP